ncbi:hypothetical protein LSH36_593g00005 [Paralvinella palmiformis]|uniref:CAP-Gly domain-containing protein n=1 Tax=Paralvinella palmiformis TaxID=53620 RepID=A0AAD9J5V9_9ANNE|nr:hypothetical protein LSH36_593g00005 [Paralvinella palmiformis]
MATAQSSLFFILVKKLKNVNLENVCPGSLWKECTTNEEVQKVGSEDISVLRQDFAFEGLTKTQFELLLAVKTDSDRLNIYQDHAWINEGRDLVIHDKVRIVNVQCLDGVTGNIRFKGALNNFGDGIMFGIELEKEFSGKGTSDGIFRGERYFTCENNCAVFYSLKCVRQVIPEGDSFRSLNYISDFLLNSRVVWISDLGPQYGWIRWLGDIETAETYIREHAGVEFDNPIGNGTGRYRGKQLFNCEKNHASLVPIAGLMLADDYEPHDSSYGSQSSRTTVFVESNDAAQSVEPEPEVRFKVGDRVKVKMRSAFRFGVVRWLGRDGYENDVAGIEMDDLDIQCYTDGSFAGQIKFRCMEHKAFFVSPKKCYLVTDKDAV